MNEQLPSGTGQEEPALEKEGEIYQQCVRLLRAVVGDGTVVLSESFTRNNNFGPTYRAQIHQNTEILSFVCWSTNGEYEFSFETAAAENGAQATK